ncbi:MAG: hypothetical protein M3R24_09730 [Chloroflexota bacterium]|nr:hypothetical protein [Chloroflexota bacterium]
MSYTLTVTVKLEGITAPLQIHADTVNDLRKQVHRTLPQLPLSTICSTYNKATTREL